MALALYGPATAQFRAPPVSESQQLLRTGDAATVDAGHAARDSNRRVAAEKYAEAFESYQKALALDPDLLAAGAGIGHAGLELKEYEKTLTLLGPLLERHPDEPELTFPIAVSHFKLRHLDVALPMLQKLSDGKLPEHLLAHYYLGQGLLSRGDGAHAAVAFKRYLDARPPELASNDSQVYELVGNSQLLERASGPAATAFRRALELGGNPASNELGLVSALELEGKSEQAIAMLDSLIKRFPKLAAPRERLARRWWAQGDTGRALQLAQGALALEDGASVRVLLGELQLAKGSPVLAEKEFRKAVQLAPQAEAPRWGLASALQAQGRHDLALQLMEDLVALPGPSVESWARLGSVARRAGHFRRALEAHQKVVALEPTRARGSLLLGADHYAEGKWESAVAAYSRALELEPQHPTARKWLARTLAQQAQVEARAGRSAQAVAPLQRAYELEATPEMGTQLGAALLLAGEATQARPLMERLVSQPGAGWQAQLVLGLAFLELDVDAGARRALDLAAKQVAQTSDDPMLTRFALALYALKAGDSNAATAQLTALAREKSEVPVAAIELNLAKASLRRAAEALAQSKVDAAIKELAELQRLLSGSAGSLAPATDLMRALVQFHRGDYRGALQLSAPFSRSSAGLQPNARELLATHSQLRMGALAEAQQSLTSAQKLAVPAQQPGLTALGRALAHRQAAALYASGAFGPAAKALRAMQKRGGADPAIESDLACIAYRQGHGVEAGETWQRLRAELPHAELNLGIQAQAQKNASQAIVHYDRYLASGGPLKAGVREWRDRLAALTGVGSTGAAPVGKEDAP